MLTKLLIKEQSNKCFSIADSRTEVVGLALLHGLADSHPAQASQLFIG